MLLLLSCSSSDPGAGEDRRALEAAARLDSKTLSLLRETEAALDRGDRTRAISGLRDAAIPAADRAIARVRELELRTETGRDASDGLLGVLRLRRDSLDTYLSAVESRDDHQLVEAIREAREVEEALVEWEDGTRRLGAAGSETSSGCAR